MIAALLGAALAVLAVPPSPPVVATVDEPAPWRLRMSVGVGVGLGLREPIVPRGPVSTSIPPSTAARVSVVPWIERTAGRGLAIHVPLSYASTIGAQIFDEGPGLARTRRIRSHRLQAATDVLMALGAPGPHRGWLGVGALGSYTMLDDIVPGSLPSYGFGLLGVRAPVVAALARGAVILGVAPAIGITLGDTRARAVGVGLGLGLAAAAWARIRITRRLGIAIDYSGCHGRWPGASRTQLDRSGMLTAGLVLTAERPTPQERRRPRAPAVVAEHEPRPQIASERRPSRETEPARGPIAPALVGTTLEGEPFDLEALRGRIVIIDFWASWCGPCREAMPRLQALQDDLGPLGVDVVGVSVDEVEADARALVDAVGISFPVIVDTQQQLAEAWQPPKMPTTFVIDRSGVIVATFAGYTAEEGERLRAEVQRLAGETASRPPP